MKPCNRFFVLLLVLLSSAAYSQDSLYETRSVYRSGKHYIIVFKYNPKPDSTGIKIVNLLQKSHSGRDSMATELLKVHYYSSRATLYVESRGGTEQLTDAIPARFVLGDENNFLPVTFTQLYNKPKKSFPKTAFFQSAGSTIDSTNGHTEHWIPAVKRVDGSFWMIDDENKGNPGDTIVLSGEYTFGYINQNYDSDIVIYTDGKQVKFSSGISIENTNHLKINGAGTDSTYGILINGGGTNLTITGKSNYINIGRVDMRNGTAGGIFDKTEVSDVQNKYDCDASYLYPTRAMYHHLHHLRLRNIGGDGLYEGSTGSSGGRPMFCGGDTAYPRPMGCGFVELDHLVIDSINRQGGQLSGCDTGFALVHDNLISNTGYEYNPNQGAGWAIGSLTKDASIYRNIFHHNFLYNFYSYGDGETRYFRNIADTAGQVGTTGTPGWKVNDQKLPSTLFSPVNAVSTLKISTNFTGYNSALDQDKPVGFAIYGDSGIYSAKGNIFCYNTGNILNNPGIDFQDNCVSKIQKILATKDVNTIIRPLGVKLVKTGDSLKYIIHPNKGYKLLDVLVDNVSVGPVKTYTFTNVTADHTITVSSEPKTYTIIVSTSGGGTAKPDGRVKVQYGSNQTFTFTNSSTHQLSKILVDGIPVGALQRYTFTNIKGNHTIHAEFKPVDPPPSTAPPIAVLDLKPKESLIQEKFDVRQLFHQNKQ